MNIFVFHLSPVVCAQQHCDRHCVKMIVEYAQLMSTAHRVLDAGLLTIEQDAQLYKQTHQNHPCAIWARASYQNYTFLFQLFEALLNEYTHRYHRIHATSRLLEVLRQEPRTIPFTAGLPFAQAMPDEYRNTDAIQAYRDYFIGAKQHIAKWTNRLEPDWFKRA